MGRKTRTISNGSRFNGTRTTVSITLEVKQCLNKLTNFLETRHIKHTGESVGLIMNDSIKLLLNNIHNKFDDLPFPEFELDFEI